MKLRHYLIVGLVGLITVQFIYYYSQLPENMASHFGGGGEANGWMTKTGFAVFEVIITVFVIGQMLLVPRMIEKMPNSAINLPNKEYWLASERRAGAINIFRSYFQWYAVGILALLLWVNQLVYRANIATSGDQKLDSSIWFLIVAFVAFTVIWLVKLILEFRKTQ